TTGTPAPARPAAAAAATSAAARRAAAYRAPPGRAARPVRRDRRACRAFRALRDRPAQQAPPARQALRVRRERQGQLLRSYMHNHTYGPRAGLTRINRRPSAAERPRPSRSPSDLRPAPLLFSQSLPPEINAFE